MQYAQSPLLHRVQQDFSQAFVPANDTNRPDDRILCGWTPLKTQLLTQWNRLTRQELDEAGPHRRRIAAVVQRRYAIEAKLVENYLRNFERTLPMA